MDIEGDVVVLQVMPDASVKCQEEPGGTSVLRWWFSTLSDPPTLDNLPMMDCEIDGSVPSTPQVASPTTPGACPHIAPGGCSTF
mmetsp:Transcript_45726/g.90765  ORF Transcript_45726/g.90765 Transcript_45726/m.90765 type:complete len:84 (-) Transcript_45726:2-253(-)